MQYFLYFLNGLICISGICEIFLIALILYDALTRSSLGMVILTIGLYAGLTSILTFSLSMFSLAISSNAEPRETLIPTIGLYLGIPTFLITLIFIYAVEIGGIIGALLGILSLIGLGILGIMTIGITVTCILMGIFGLIVLLWLVRRAS